MNTLDRIESLTKDPAIAAYIEEVFGGVDRCRKDILCKFIGDFVNSALVSHALLDDFFRHGFDGSGADNYFDAGSCIDGRLTSAWNCK